MFEMEEKVDIPLKKYPTYCLFARIKAKDKQKFLDTWDESLILYKFCQNGYKFATMDQLNEDRKRRLIRR